MIEIQEVEIAGNTYKVPYLLNTDAGQKKLQTAKSAKLNIYCKCMPEKLLLISARRHGNGYVLARFPNTGPLHSLNCDDYLSDPTQSGAGHYDSNAIRETEDGYAIRLGVSLRRKGRNLDDPGLIKTGDDDKPHKKFSRLGLFGLLHFLWANSRLNSWRGVSFESCRKWNDVANRIDKQLKIMTSKSTEMSGLVVLPRTSNGSFIDKQLTEIKQKLPRQGADPQTVELRILIGHLIRLKESQYDGFGLIVEDRKESFWIGGAEWAQAVNACPYPSIERVIRELSINERMERVVVIGRIEHTEKGNLKFIDLRLMAVTKDFIPVDSSYERQLSDYLVENNRQFEKPLAYDAEDGVFPDFLLTDIEPVLPMEVWGMTGNPEYDARKKTKLAEYARKGSVWEWDPTSCSVIPELPPAH